MTSADTSSKHATSLSWHDYPGTRPRTEGWLAVHFRDGGVKDAYALRYYRSDVGFGADDARITAWAVPPKGVAETVGTLDKIFLKGLFSCLGLVVRALATYFIADAVLEYPGFDGWQKAFVLATVVWFGLGIRFRIRSKF